MGSAASMPGYVASATNSEKLKAACASLDGDARKALLEALMEVGTSEKDPPACSTSVDDLIQLIEGKKHPMPDCGEDPFSPEFLCPTLRPFPGPDAGEEARSTAQKEMELFAAWWQFEAPWVKGKVGYVLPYPGYLPPFKRLGDAALDVTDFVTTRYHAWRPFGYNKGNPYTSGLLGLPRFHQKFDWWIANKKEMSQCGKGFCDKRDPKVILCSVNCNDAETPTTLLKYLEQYADKSHRRRTIIFGGGDRRLSLADHDVLTEVAKWCDAIRWEAKDVHLTLGDVQVETMPIGLTENYYRQSAPMVNAVINSVTLEMKTRVPSVLAAWGASAHFGAHMELGPAQETRMKANEWAEAHPDIVDRRSIPWNEYWSEMSSYRFLLYPQGDGVQSPKYLEGLLAFTIPIALRCVAFEDLEKYGFPIVVLDSFDEITEEKLDEWWARLSPSLPKTRERFLVDNYFEEFIREAAKYIGNRR